MKLAKRKKDKDIFFRLSMNMTNPLEAKILLKDYLDAGCGICYTKLRDVLDGKGNPCCQDWEIVFWKELHPGVPHPWTGVVS